jgi:hypothetical protein
MHTPKDLLQVQGAASGSGEREPRVAARREGEGEGEGAVNRESRVGVGAGVVVKPGSWELLVVACGMRLRIALLQRCQIAHYRLQMQIQGAPEKKKKATYLPTFFQIF